MPVNPLNRVNSVQSVGNTHLRNQDDANDKPPTPETGFILREDGTHLLREDGDKFLRDVF